MWLALVTVTKGLCQMLRHIVMSLFHEVIWNSWTEAELTKGGGFKRSRKKKRLENGIVTLISEKMQVSL